MSGRPFIAARVEDRFNALMNRIWRRLGWRERIVGYTGYGTESFVRVLARVVLAPTSDSPVVPVVDRLLNRRGWRNFFTAPVVAGRVTVRTAGRTSTAGVSRNGYLDLRIHDHGLPPGWHDVEVEMPGADPVTVPVRVVAADESLGLVSDIDDTVISTSLPRPLIAFWNTFVLRETARQPVPGMAQMYRSLLAERPGAPIFYLSTGAWNTAETLTRFLAQHGFPPGPLLLTDWGPTNTGWFRSGPVHKLDSLYGLAHDFPDLDWVLVGDDGQHDPTLYHQFARHFPGRVRAIGIRQLSVTEQVLAHATPVPLLEEDHRRNTESPTPEVRAPDGERLEPLLRACLRD